MFKQDFSYKLSKKLKMDANEPYNLSTSTPSDANEFYSNYEIKVATIPTLVLMLTPILLHQFGIIWYEKNGRFRYRTVINRLFSSFCLAVTCFHLVLCIPESMRIMGGPLNETFCSIRILLQKFLGFYCFLTFDAITLIRYTYIFKVANFAVIDDDFVTKCSVLSNIILSAWCVGVMHMNPGAYPVIDMM